MGSNPILWMSSAMLASLFYAICNTINGKLSIQEGFTSQLYQVPGLWLCCIAFFTYKIVSREKGQPWNYWILQTFYIKDEIDVAKEKK
jgi:hypothetical protein